MSQVESGWKDRGWWLSVDFPRQSKARRKNLLFALEALGKAAERYDLIDNQGRTISRGIFGRTAQTFGALSNLLTTIRSWQDVAVFVRGKKVERGGYGLLCSQLICAAGQAPCMPKSAGNTWRFLGCHQAKIGLLHFSLTALKKGAPFWFNFLEKGSGNRFVLNKETLVKAVFLYELCPYFPQETREVIDRLPVAIDLNSRPDRDLWTPVRYRIRSRWLVRYPPVVPKSSAVYTRRMSRIISGASEAVPKKSRQTGNSCSRRNPSHDE